MEPVELTKQLLDDVRECKKHSNIIREIKELDREMLENDLDTDEKIKAFWINFYNAEAQVIVERHPVLHRLNIIFSIPFSNVTGKRLSLNKIEYGLLRRSKGLLGTKKLLEPRFEKRFRVEKVDPRIHFALNWGSESCPAIRYYEPGQIDSQLDQAAEKYLSETIKMEKDVIHLPTVFEWFEEDFGGAHGIREFLKDYGYSGFDRMQFKSFDHKKRTRRFSD